MLDYGIPEPAQQPIIAPDEDSDKRKKQGLPLPARPNWLCICDPKNLATASATMKLAMQDQINKQETIQEKIKEEEKRKIKSKARHEERIKHERAMQKERDKRKTEKKRARAAEKAKAKKTPVQIAEMRRKQAAYMRELMAKKRVKKVPEVSSDRIKAFLLASKLNRRQLAVLIGVSETSVDSYCSGHGMCPSALARFKELEGNWREENENVR